MSDPTPALKVDRLDVALGGKTILSEVDLEANEGAFVAVVGPNGAGKSTLLKAAAGLLGARHGSIAVAGTPLNRLSPRERAVRLGYLPQGHAFHWPMSVREVVGLGRLPRGSGADSSEEDRLAVERALERTGTAELAERMVTTLSGGERARVAMARVLATETPLILADEPTASLDPRYQLVVLDILKRHTEANGATVAVLHDLGMAARYADWLVLLDSGRVVDAGRPDVVLTEGRIAETFGVSVEILEREGATVVIPRSVI